GQSVYFDTVEGQFVFKCLQDCSGQLPDEPESLFWEQKDERHPSIKLHLLDITIFNLYAASPVIPQLRIDRYDAAMKWLKMVLDGKITPDLPKLPEETNATMPSPIRLGSRQKLRHSW
ncbi:MAG: DUF1320 domain-containing protein, partial [Hymenobacteraceae bacterium]|nr:DUF1320 domain-containing protein [Hymenobacteraceae bacterium]